MNGAPPLLIAGPTASGKSAYARMRATEQPSVIVNADALQVYAELRILSARPSSAEEASVPHRLFGFVRASERYSVGRWLADVARALNEARQIGWRPIIVGGTGLYFRALTTGLAPVPEIPDALRRDLRDRIAGLPAADLHRLLAERSPVEAARLRPSDRSRVVRAIEVLEATGRPLSVWQAEPALATVDLATAERVVLEVERATLNRRIEARFRAMLDAGALAEAASLRGLDPDSAAMKAVGLRPLLRHLSGETDIDSAVANAVAETRQYAKRQETWFRNQMGDWPRIAMT